MPTAHQIIELKHLALKTSRHLPHNENWRWARTYIKQFNEPRAKQEILEGSTGKHWLTDYYFDREEQTLISLGELT